MSDYWESRLKPFHIDQYFAAEERRVLSAAADNCDLKSCLDIGCGDPSRGRYILRGAEFLDSADLNPFDMTVQKGDVRTYSGGPYTTILCCRVLCNLPEHERAAAVKNLADLLTPHGRLILADSLLTVRDRVQVYRKDKGWEPLPESSSRSSELADDTLRALAKHFRVVGLAPVAPDYMIWTRRDQEKLATYDDPKRYNYPRYTQIERWTWSWPRVWIAEKVL